VYEELIKEFNERRATMTLEESLALNEFLLSSLSTQTKQLTYHSERISKLEAERNQTSKNSNKPPSSDEFKKERGSKRKGSGKRKSG